jgi:regulator of replication initiation timing
MKITKRQLREIVRSVINEGVGEYYAAAKSGTAAATFVALNGGSIADIVSPGATTEEIKSAVDEIIDNYDGDMDRIGDEIVNLSKNLSSLIDALGRLIPENPNLNIEAFEEVMRHVKQEGLSDDKLEVLKTAIINIVVQISEKRPESQLAIDKDQVVNRIRRSV